MPADLFRISQVQAANVIELLLPDALDAVEFDRLNDSVLNIIDGNGAQPWILDLSAVTYAGSAVLGLMVNLRQRVKQANGKLILCCMSPRLVEIFQACCMERLFTIVRTRSDALKAASWRRLRRPYKINPTLRTATPPASASAVRTSSSG